MTNITNFTFEKTWLIPQNQVYYVEELCQPYIESLSKAYITVAIFNLFYSFTWLWLKNRKDKVLLKLPLESFTFTFTIGSISFMLDIIFFMLNFFVIGYWLILQNPTLFMELPIIRWFI